MDVLNVSNSNDSAGPPDFFELFGPKNPYFKLIHYTALVCLAISITVSIYTLIYLVNHGNKNIFKRKIGEYNNIHQLVWLFLASVLRQQA